MGYSGFAPMLFKQIPYTMAKFSVQQVAAEKIYASLGTSPDKMSKSGVITVSLGSGVIAGVAAATISQPADGLLSKVNKKGAGGEGAIFTRIGRIAKEVGMCMFSVGASRFHFHDPAKH